MSNVNKGDGLKVLREKVKAMSIQELSALLKILTRKSGDAVDEVNIVTHELTERINKQ